jgi:CHAT domain-containing protein
VSHWRVERPRGGKGEWACYDALTLRWSGIEARCATRSDPVSNLPVDPKRPLARPELTTFDLLDACTRYDRVHVILHGEYDRADPRRSGLHVVPPGTGHPTQYLPLWVIAAIGIEAHLVILSACESNLYGLSTEALLGPVGIGPSLIGARAQAVLGTLWPCEDLTTLVFVHHLKRLETKSEWAGRPLREQVEEAKWQLHETTGADLETVLRELAGGQETFEDRYEPYAQGRIEMEQPFTDPLYWAPYVVLGELLEKPHSNE